MTRTKRKPVRKKKCPGCKSSFIVTRSNTKYCSRVCYEQERYRKVTRIKRRDVQSRSVRVDLGPPVRGATTITLCDRCTTPWEVEISLLCPYWLCPRCRGPQ